MVMASAVAATAFPLAESEEGATVTTPSAFPLVLLLLLHRPFHPFHQQKALLLLLHQPFHPFLWQKVLLLLLHQLFHW